MESYVTWSDLIQLLIAFSSWAGVIVALIALFYNIYKKK